METQTPPVEQDEVKARHQKALAALKKLIALKLRDAIENDPRVKALTQQIDDLDAAHPDRAALIEQRQQRRTELMKHPMAALKKKLSPVRLIALQLEMTIKNDPRIKELTQQIDDLDAAHPDRAALIEQRQQRKTELMEEHPMVGSLPQQTLNKPSAEQVVFGMAAADALAQASQDRAKRKGREQEFIGVKLAGEGGVAPLLKVIENAKESYRKYREDHLHIDGVGKSPELTSAEIAAISVYTSQYYDQINSCRRMGGDATLGKNLSNSEALVKKRSKKLAELSAQVESLVAGEPGHDEAQKRYDEYKSSLDKEAWKGVPDLMQDQKVLKEAYDTHRGAVNEACKTLDAPNQDYVKEHLKNLEMFILTNTPEEPTDRSIQACLGRLRSVVKPPELVEKLYKAMPVEFLAHRKCVQDLGTNMDIMADTIESAVSKLQQTQKLVSGHHRKQLEQLEPGKERDEYLAKNREYIINFDTAYRIEEKAGYNEERQRGKEWGDSAPLSTAQEFDGAIYGSEKSELINLLDSPIAADIAQFSFFGAEEKELLVAPNKDKDSFTTTLRLERSPADQGVEKVALWLERLAGGCYQEINPPVSEEVWEGGLKDKFTARIATLFEEFKSTRGDIDKGIVEKEKTLAEAEDKLRTLSGQQPDASDQDAVKRHAAALDEARKALEDAQYKLNVQKGYQKKMGSIKVIVWSEGKPAKAR